MFVVRQSVVRRPHHSNIFSSETTGPIKNKCHSLSGIEEQNDPGHVTKIAATLIYDKNPSKISGTKGPMTLVLGMQHWELGHNEICSNGDLGSTWPFLRHGQICFLMLLYGKIYISSGKKNVRKLFNWRNLQQITRVINGLFSYR